MSLGDISAPARPLHPVRDAPVVDVLHDVLVDHTILPDNWTVEHHRPPALRCVPHRIAVVPAETSGGSATDVVEVVARLRRYGCATTFDFKADRAPVRQARNAVKDGATIVVRVASDFRRNRTVEAEEAGTGRRWPCSLYALAQDVADADAARAGRAIA